MKFHIIFPALFLLANLNLTAQNTVHKSGLGFEIQAYPSGQLIGVTFEKMRPEKHVFDFRAAYNRVRHGDAGVHDDETGGGFGGSIGYRRFFKNNFNGWHLGLRIDVWFNTIDWEDYPMGGSTLSGTTDIIVVQPTVKGGYTFLFKNYWILDFSLAFGREFNVQTRGEPTGEGFILLGGFTFGKRF